MRTSTLPLLLLIAAPLTAVALQIQPGNLYTDVRSSSREAAGINMLSREGIVQGYGNGFFGVTRQINRAEFLKIAMKSAGLSNPSAKEGDCFPDVHREWFAPFVCWANAIQVNGLQVVAGYADGLFHPELTVTYGEALKMLDLLFAYDIPEVSAPHWAEAYYRAAAAAEVDLPITIDLDTPLTRGHAARLIAAFLAKSEGQLAELRLAEAGVFGASSSSSSVSSSSSSSSVSSSVSSSSSSSSSVAASLFTLPPLSHFLVTGAKSDAIADIVLRSNGEVSRIANVQVKLYQEVLALDSLELVRASDGGVAAVLKRRVTTDTDDYKLTFETQLNLADQMRVAADTDERFVLRAVVKSIANNGASEQLLEVRTFSVTMQGETTNMSRNIPAVAPFPRHQTSFGRVTQVLSTSLPNGNLVFMTGGVVSAFSFSGSTVPGKSITIEQLTFRIQQVGHVTVSNWKINAAGSANFLPCSLSQDGLSVSCATVTSIGAIGSSPLTLELRADVTVTPGSTDGRLEAYLDAPGSPSVLGAVQWTDQSGHFRWIESASPVIARGTRFE